MCLAPFPAEVLLTGQGLQGYIEGDLGQGLRLPVSDAAATELLHGCSDLKQLLVLESNHPEVRGWVGLDKARATQMRRLFGAWELRSRGFGGDGVGIKPIRNNRKRFNGACGKLFRATMAVRRRALHPEWRCIPSQSPQTPTRNTNGTAI